MSDISADRRRILIGAGLLAAVVIPAGIYTIPRMGEPAVDPNADAEPLSNDEQTLVAAMAEGIIPRTDTPGAIAAEVPAFITMLFAEWMNPDEQTAFRAGLEEFQRDARARHGKPFEKLAADKQLALLVEWDAAATAARTRGDAALPAFAKFKSLVVVGYYTSKVGQDTELQVVMSAGQDNPNGPVMMPVPFNV